ncbi:hypothetical protein A2765_04275 [Candidatus Kaiserbacteria bacterium RIFCSPHIGHO2_01_FULL_56_24]|uniref:DUF2933 domain-containing protein n=1 Tax=Candidatus Kaiserbacteria bacterium RIFCSPHIGHO2_01_FULL_56_24 TaxID=1798487 RepID=A0A1F6DEH9_9BACT|nr:MAG: hypothetical protein A2765_04275 [Candidatus Kaiserbacteria bacterium RIFCSPHIGHO2_01_FULL_56_24]
MKDTVRWILVALLILAGGYILVDHGEHLVPYLPFAFLSGCLFMHMFMHRGHGHGGHGDMDQTHKEK